MAIAAAAALFLTAATPARETADPLLRDAENAGAICPSERRPNLPVMVGSVVRLVPANEALAATVQNAIDRWRSCPRYGVGFPRFSTDESEASDSTVSVRIEERWTGAGRCGQIGRGGEIVLFLRVRDDSGRVHDCQPVGPILAHELGHVLGLADADPAEEACRDSVMGQLSAEDLRLGRAASRFPSATECSLADSRWMTWEELERGSLSRSERPRPPSFRATPLESAASSRRPSSPPPRS